MGRGREGDLKERKENERSFSVLCEQLVFWELLSGGGWRGRDCDVSTLLCQPNGTAATAGGLCVHRSFQIQNTATIKEAITNSSARRWLFTGQLLWDGYHSNVDTAWPSELVTTVQAVRVHVNPISRTMSFVAFIPWQWPRNTDMISDTRHKLRQLRQRLTDSPSNLAITKEWTINLGNAGMI